jgi:hypothetical protein
MRFAMRFFAALLGILAALALLSGAATRDDWGSGVQYPLGTIAIAGLVAVGYVAARLWVLLVPWIGAAVLVVAGAVAEGDPSVLLGIVLLGLWAALIDIPLAAGVGLAHLRRSRRARNPALA